MRDNIKDYVIDFGSIDYKRESIPRILWGIKDLDYYTKGIEVGLTILVADTNAGKTVFTSNLIMNASEQDYNTCVFASEHTAESYKMLIMSQNATAGDFMLVPFKDNNGKDTNIADFYVNEKKEAQVNYKLGGKLKIYNNKKSERDINTIIEFIEYCHNEYGCKVVILDNAMEIEAKGLDQNASQTNMLTLLRDTLLRLNMFGILVMHINKESANLGFRLSVKSASGTSNSGNKAYNVIALYRKDCIYEGKGQEKMIDKFKQDLAQAGFNYDSCDSFIDVLKTKGNGNGVVGLIFDTMTKTYKQAPKISKTEADKIYKSLEPKQNRWDTIQCESIVADGDLPF
jgi:archaellum biogenesis ATPase FlaH